MKAIKFFTVLLTAVVTLSIVSCKRDEDNKTANSPCSGFFQSNHPSGNFSALSVSGSGTTFSAYFTKDQSYNVTVETNGNITIKTNTSDIVFNGGTDITECKDEGHEYNVFYENATSGIKLIFQEQDGIYTLALRKIDNSSDFATLKL